MPTPPPTYRLTRQADADLKNIYHYGRRTWGQAQAVRYASQFQQCFTMLATRPHAGRPRTEFQPPGLRSFGQGSHVIFYQPQPYGVLIVRVLHSSQDVTRHLGGEETP
jgi:toxin ParE1/3/4